MSTDLISLIPDQDEISSERLLSVSNRLVTLLRDQYPDIDVSVNTVFSDHVMRPMIYMIAGFEHAADCVLGDIDLTNILQGNVCDCTRAEDFLRTLGSYNSASVPTVATVRLEYNTDLTKRVQNSARFVFADTIVLRPLTLLSGDLTIVPSTSSQAQPYNNVYRLARTEVGTFFVDLPVYGASGSDQAVSGTTGTTDVVDASLVAISLASPVVALTEPDTLSDLAARAQRVFPSSALTTRSSAVSFFTNKLTNIAGVSPVMPGDIEMQRGGDNLFGVRRNAVDIYPRGRSMVTGAIAVITVAHDTEDGRDRWVGELALPHRAVRIRQFVTETGLVIPVESIVGASRDPSTYPGLSGAFSSNEELGLIFSDTYSADITRGNTATDLTATPVESTGADDAQAVVTGNYTGHIFSSAASQALTITGTAGNTFTVRNNWTAEEVTGMTSTAGAGTNRVLTNYSGSDPVLAERWLHGLTVELRPNSEPNFEGLEVVLDYTAEFGRIHVEYDYDPFLGECEQLARNDTAHAAFDIAVMSARPCVLDKLLIRYRTDFGRWVDTGQALKELAGYMDQTLFPAVLEDSRLSDILLFAGASGVRKIEKSATVYTTLATLYSTDRRDTLDSAVAFLEAGTDYTGSLAIDWSGNQTNLEAIVLDDSSNNGYAGPRNIQFLIDRADITLIEQRD